MSNVIRLVDNVNKVIKIIIAFFLGVMSSVIIAQVVSRYFFHHTFTWAEELSRYLMVYSVFLGAALALRTQSLIAVEVLAESISQSKKRILKLIVYIVCLVFFILLFCVGVYLVGEVSAQRSPALQIKMSIPYLAIPLGSLALILNALAVIFELIMDKQNVENGVKY